MNRDRIINFLKKHYKTLGIGTIIAITVIGSTAYVKYTKNKINHQQMLLDQAAYDIEKLNGQINQLNINIDDLSNDNLTLQGNLDYVNKLNVQITNERDSLQQKNTELQDKMKFNETRIEYLEQRNNELNEDLKKN